MKKLIIIASALLLTSSLAFAADHHQPKSEPKVDSQGMVHSEKDHVVKGQDEHKGWFKHHKGWFDWVPWSKHHHDKH